MFTKNCCKIAIFTTGRVLALALLLSIPGCSQQETLREASGIGLDGSDLIIVSDDSPGTLFRYKLTAKDQPSGNGPLLARITISKTQSRMITHKRAMDLEGVDLLPDGRIALLSEQLGALFTHEGLVAQYPKTMAEVAGRGLEGLTIHDSGKIAALWEGGYFSPKALSKVFAYKNGLSDLPQTPLICIHPFPTASGTPVCMNGEGMKTLKVPQTPVASQAFRAPDLVWSVDGESFVVLLTSQNAADNVFKFMWLQKFTETGEPVGEPINLCDNGYLPKDLRSGRSSNFEGLDWFDPGKSLILINDYSRTATAVVIAVQPWPVTDKTVACDQTLP